LKYCGLALLFQPPRFGSSAHTKETGYKAGGWQADNYFKSIQISFGYAGVLFFPFALAHKILSFHNPPVNLHPAKSLQKERQVSLHEPRSFENMHCVRQSMVSII
jgi:hypothetical protein